MTASLPTHVPLIDDAVYTEAEAAAHLRVGRTGLRSRRWRGEDVPAHFFVGNRAMYRGSDIRAWIDNRAKRAAAARSGSRARVSR